MSDPQHTQKNTYYKTFLWQRVYTVLFRQTSRKTPNMFSSLWLHINFPQQQNCLQSSYGQVSWDYPDWRLIQRGTGDQWVISRRGNWKLSTVMMKYRPEDMQQLNVYWQFVFSVGLEKKGILFINYIKHKQQKIFLKIFH